MPNPSPEGKQVTAGEARLRIIQLARPARHSCPQRRKLVRRQILPCGVRLRPPLYALPRQTADWSFLNLRPRAIAISGGVRRVGSSEFGTDATAGTGNAELCPRLRPSRRILEINVVRRTLRRAAAPFGPPTTPPVCRRVCRMCELSASFSVTGAHAFCAHVRSDSEPVSTGPLERITERSMKFCNSRILPGQV